MGNLDRLLKDRPMKALFQTLVLIEKNSHATNRDIIIPLGRASYRAVFSVSKHVITISPLTMP